MNIYGHASPSKILNKITIFSPLWIEQQCKSNQYQRTKYYLNNKWCKYYYIVPTYTLCYNHDEANFSQVYLPSYPCFHFYFKFATWKWPNATQRSPDSAAKSCISNNSDNLI